MQMKENYSAQRLEVIGNDGHSRVVQIAYALALQVHDGTSSSWSDQINSKPRPGR